MLVNSSEDFDQISRGYVGHIDAIDFPNPAVDVWQLQVVHACKIPQAGFVGDKVRPYLHAKDCLHKLLGEAAKHVQLVGGSQFDPLALEWTTRDDLAMLAHIVRARDATPYRTPVLRGYCLERYFKMLGLADREI